MAALAADQIELVYNDSKTDRFALFAVKRVTTGDTVDVSAWFKDAKLAAVLFTTTAKRAALPNPAANVITLDTTAVTNDAGWLMVWGTAN